MVSQADFCKRVGCTQAACDQEVRVHAAYVRLPSPNEETPEYLKDIIAICRAANPKARMPARKLLKKLLCAMKEDDPSTRSLLRTDQEETELTYSQRDETSEAKHRRYFTREEDVVRVYGDFTFCSLCSGDCSRHYFHCGVCDSSDFDLCPSCFAKGMHCQDPGHFLREYRDPKTDEHSSVDPPETGYYYSAIRELGMRDIRRL